jgi:hypothetical protein
MAILLRDRIATPKRRKMENGFMVADGSVIGRAGNVQPYTRKELGLTGAPHEIEQIYRDPKEVFSDDAIGSFADVPLTIGHPDKPVTKDNWRKLSHGDVQAPEADAQAGELRARVVIKSSEANRALDGGLKYLSCGYLTDVDMTPGRTPDGTAYTGRQTNIRGNHVALVDDPRGGLSCKVSDSHNKGKRMAQFIIDDVPVDVDDSASPIVTSLIKKRDDARAIADSATAEKTKLQVQVADQAAKISTLEKAAAPDVIEARVQARATLISDACRLVPKFAVEAKSDAQIRREVIRTIAVDGSTAKSVLTAFGSDADKIDDALLEVAFRAVAGAHKGTRVTADRAIGDALAKETAREDEPKNTTLKHGQFKAEGGK